MFEICDIVEYEGRTGEIFSVCTYNDDGGTKSIAIRFDAGDIVTVHGCGLDVVEIAETRENDKCNTETAHGLRTAMPSTSALAR